MDDPQKIKNGIVILSSNSTSENIYEENKDSNSKDIFPSIFIAALFTIAKRWKQPKVYIYR